MGIFDRVLEKLKLKKKEESYIDLTSDYVMNVDTANTSDYIMSVDTANRYYNYPEFRNIRGEMVTNTFDGYRITATQNYDPYKDVPERDLSLMYSLVVELKSFMQMHEIGYNEISKLTETETYILPVLERKKKVRGISDVMNDELTKMRRDEFT